MPTTQATPPKPCSGCPSTNRLYELLRSERNVGPRFRMPNLISACVSQMFAKGDASHRLFNYLGAELILREPATIRRRGDHVAPPVRSVAGAADLAANRYPNPQFQLDQLTTGGVAFAREVVRPAPARCATPASTSCAARPT